MVFNFRRCTDDALFGLGRCAHLLLLSFFSCCWWSFLSLSPRGESGLLLSAAGAAAAGGVLRWNHLRPDDLRSTAAGCSCLLAPPSREDEDR
jgi:hypothetical protein